MKIIDRIAETIAAKVISALDQYYQKQVETKSHIRTNQHAAKPVILWNRNNIFWFKRMQDAAAFCEISFGLMSRNISLGNKCRGYNVKTFEKVHKVGNMNPANRSTKTIVYNENEIVCFESIKLAAEFLGCKSSEYRFAKALKGEELGGYKVVLLDELITNRE